ncbi:MAG: hypothetical protein AB4042_14285 [Leptolyngbyaceae cyanobacterium]
MYSCFFPGWLWGRSRLALLPTLNYKASWKGRSPSLLILRSHIDHTPSRERRRRSHHSSPNVLSSRLVPSVSLRMTIRGSASKRNWSLRLSDRYPTRDRVPAIWILAIANYKEDMFPMMAEDDTTRDTEQGFTLKPMNCPFHIQIFKNTLRSYRELPM